MDCQKTYRQTSRKQGPLHQSRSNTDDESNKKAFQQRNGDYVHMKSIDPCPVDRLEIRFAGSQSLQISPSHY